MSFIWHVLLHLFSPFCVNFVSSHEKETPAQVFSFGYRKIFKNTYFEEPLRTAASVHLKLFELFFGTIFNSLTSGFH